MYLIVLNLLPAHTKPLQPLHSGNTGSFYRYANSKLKSKVNAAPLIIPSDGVTSGEELNFEHKTLIQIKSSNVSGDVESQNVTMIVSVYSEQVQNMLNVS